FSHYEKMRRCTCIRKNLAYNCKRRSGMTEALPVLGGIVLGLLSREPRIYLSGPRLIFTSFVIGALCSLLTGELSITWIYIIVDSLAVIGVCLVTRVLVWWLGRMIRSA